MQTNRPPLFSFPQYCRFYVFNQREAQEFDAAQPEGQTYFTDLLPGGNAYLLDDDAFDFLLHEDLDPGDTEPGYSIQFSPTIVDAQRFQISSGLTALGYAVSLYTDHILVVPWQREIILSPLAGDIYQIVSAFSRKREKETVFPVSAEQARAWLNDADRFIALAQEFFGPFETSSDEMSPSLPPNALLYGAASRFQKARCFIEEGSDNLEKFLKLEARLLLPQVTARCYSDDAVISVDLFDATPWFVQASDEEICDVRDEGYVSGETVDAIAELAANYDLRVHAMFEHNESLPEDTELNGFSCSVNKAEVEAWLAIHRRHLLSQETDKVSSVSQAGLMRAVDQKVMFLKAVFEQQLQSLGGYLVDHVEWYRSQAGEIYMTIVADDLAQFTFPSTWQPPTRYNLSTIDEKMAFLQTLFADCSLGGYPITGAELHWVDQHAGSFMAMVVADWGAELTFSSDQWMLGNGEPA